MDLTDQDKVDESPRYVVDSYACYATSSSRTAKQRLKEQGLEVKVPNKLRASFSADIASTIISSKTVYVTARPNRDADP
jgi:hypothetical protein